MGRARLFVLLLGVSAALLSLPGVAAAADFTWSLTSDFTASPPGANPDDDTYGGHPWTYEKGGGTRLGTFGTRPGGSLPAWTDGGNAPFVAIDSSGGHAVLGPSASAPAVVAWTSPLSGTVTVAGSVTAEQLGTPVLCPNATWTVLKNGASTGATGTSTTTSSSFSMPISVTPGDRVTLETSVPALTVGLACARTAAHFTITAADPAPAVTLETPANGATITSGQPTFSGKADTSFGALPIITVRVFSGSDTTGTPVRTLTTTAANGSYRVTASPALPDGTYTAQAEQDGLTGGKGFSSKNTFVLQTRPATITLDSPGSAPLHTATPTLTGTAAHSASVRIAVHTGDTTDSATIATATGTAGTDGAFSVRLPALADGRYTAIATDGAGHISDPVTFRIKVHPPALTLTEPVTGGYLSQNATTFAGAAGQALGDAQQVSVTLFGGATPRARNLGTKRATRVGGSWSLRWATHLALGTYTVRASQTDDAGHTTTVTHTFQLVTGPVGPSVDVSSAGLLSIPVFCTASAGQTCSGTVLILTKKVYRTAGGGLAGRLRVMFAYVSLPGGGTVVIHRRVQTDALRALRQTRRVPVVVIATLRSGGGAARRVAVDRVITVRTAGHR